VAMSTIEAAAMRYIRASEEGAGSEPPRCRRLLNLTAAPLAPLGIIFMAGVAVIGGCTSQSGAVAEAGIGQPAPKPGYGLPTRLASADSEVVDCQLPPRIHRLGIHLTYLGAERQITTTPRDCASRGGDSAAPDAASRG
jgi:hypothetical protein